MRVCTVLRVNVRTVVWVVVTIFDAIIYCFIVIQKLFFLVIRTVGVKLGHSFSSLSHDRFKASSKANSPHTSPFLKVVQ
jgi:hypothetical protein